MFPQASRYMMTAFLLAFILGCAPSYPGGAVKYAADAAVLAKHKCGSGGKELFGAWSASLDGHTWNVKVVSQSNVSFSVTIDARTGEAGNCHAI